MDNKNFNFPEDKIFQYITYGIILAFILFNLESVWDFFLNALGLARPFYIAIVIAFVINIPMKLVEKLLVKAREQLTKKKPGSLTVVSNFSLTKSLKTLIISMLLSFFIVKFVKINVLIWANVCYNIHRR